MEEDTNHTDVEEEIDVLKRKLEDSEAKCAKMRLLAVKLKKDLAEATKPNADTAHGDAKSNDQIKDQLRHVCKEKEKIQGLYQQSIRNFQNIQSEYDKLQDGYEQVKKEAKQTTTDLTNSISELTKLREELAEVKHDNDGLKSRIELNESELASMDEKKKSLETNVMILEKKLNEERHKVTEHEELEKELTESNEKLERKSNEVFALQDELETASGYKREADSFRDTIRELNFQLDQTKAERNSLDEVNKDIFSRFETINRDFERDRVRLSDLTNENARLESTLAVERGRYSKYIKSLEIKVVDAERHMKISLDELELKQGEFELYKIRVRNVLRREESSVTLNQQQLAKISDLEETIENLNEELNRVRDRLTEIERVKSDLECEVSNFKPLNLQLSEQKRNVMKESEILLQEVTDLKLLLDETKTRSTSERKLLEKRIEDMETRHNESVSQLEEEIRRRNEEAKRDNDDVSTVSSSTEIFDDSKVESNYVNGIGDDERSETPLIIDDVESIESESIRCKRLSTSSAASGSIGPSVSRLMHPLEEILYSSANKTSSKMTGSDREENVHLNCKLNSMQQLLEESETESFLLNEQNNVLKEEVRRLQRSIERLEMVDNLEYLKNIVVKFIGSSPQDRVQLLPVIRTLLKLSKPESELLEAAATVRESQVESAATNAAGQSWGSMLWGR